MKYLCVLTCVLYGRKTKLLCRCCARLWYSIKNNLSNYCFETRSDYRVSRWRFLMVFSRLYVSAELTPLLVKSLSADLSPLLFVVVVTHLIRRLFKQLLKLHGSQLIVVKLIKESPAVIHHEYSYCNHERLSLNPLLSQLNPVNFFTPSFSSSLLSFSI